MVNYPERIASMRIPHFLTESLRNVFRIYGSEKIRKTWKRNRRRAQIKLACAVLLICTVSFNSFRRIKVVWISATQSPMETRVCPLPSAAAVITVFQPNRAKNLNDQVVELLKSCFITEIVVWNNNQLMHVRAKHPSIRVVNSAQNLGTIAKYRACLLAGSSACYIIDDDWKPIFVDRMYSVFLENGNDATVALTDPITQHMDDSMVFHFEDDLHFGFAWIGVGSFISRQEAQQFLNKASLIPKHLLRHSDIFFTIFSNKIPLTISAKLVPLAKNNSPEKMSSSPGYIQMLSNAWKAAYSVVRQNAPRFQNSWEGNKLKDVRSICENGDLILDNAHHGKLRKTVSSFIAVDGDEEQLAINYPHFNMCDGNDTTAYRPLGEMFEGRYLGYKFAQPMKLLFLEITLGIHESVEIKYTNFAIEVQNLNGVWGQASVSKGASSAVSISSGRVKHKLVYALDRVNFVAGVRIKVVEFFSTINGGALFYDFRPFSAKLSSIFTKPNINFQTDASIGASTCGQDVSLFVAITSTANAVSRRNTIRKTFGEWASKDGRFKVMFALAKSTSALKEVSDEIAEFNDMIMLDVDESYDHLSLKTVKIFEWFSSHCESARYFMKIDDDSFVQFDALLHKLRNNNEEYVYMGHIFTKQEVYHDPKQKNFEPNYDGDIYPPYASGSGYILSSQLVRLIANRANNASPGLRIIRNEDAAVGLWLVGLDITTIHDATFFPERIERCRSDALLLHRLSSTEIARYYTNWRGTGDICTRT